MRSPGSEMPGVPASLTIATSRPSASTPSTSATRLNSVWSLHTASRSALTPACCSNRPVRRVSSQQISPTWESTSTARGERSARLPIGVATSQSVLTTRPRRAGAAVVVAAVVVAAEFDLVADAEAPASERAAFGLDHPARAPHRDAEAVPVHVHRLDHDAVAVEVGDVDREAHPDRVDPAAAFDHERAVETVPAEQAAASGPAGVGHFRRGQHAGVTDQPSHPRSVPDDARSRRACSWRWRSRWRCRRWWWRWWWRWRRGRAGLRSPGGSSAGDRSWRRLTRSS